MEIERAVYKAYTANEATVSRIVLKADGNAYYEKMETLILAARIEIWYTIEKNVAFELRGMSYAKIRL